MKKIGIISDTHGWLEPGVIEHFANCDELWHAGDFGSLAIAEALQQLKPLRGVYGNIDGQEIRALFPEYLIFTTEQLKVLIIHIGGYPGKYAAKARQLILLEKPDIFVCGHSHILRVMRDPKYGNMLVLNPGAAGREGVHLVKTILKLEVDNRKVINLKIIELGQRASL